MGDCGVFMYDVIGQYMRMTIFELPLYVVDDSLAGNAGVIISCVIVIIE